MAMAKDMQLGSKGYRGQWYLGSDFNIILFSLIYLVSGGVWGHLGYLSIVPTESVMLVLDGEL